MPNLMSSELAAVASAFLVFWVAPTLLSALHAYRRRAALSAASHMPVPEAGATAKAGPEQPLPAATAPPVAAPVTPETAAIPETATPVTEEVAETPIKMTRVYVQEAMGKIDLWAREVLAACSEGDELRTMLAALRRLVRYTPIDTMHVRLEIADHFIDHHYEDFVAHATRLEAEVSDA